MNYYDLHQNSISDLENMLREGLIASRAYRNILKSLPKGSFEYRQAWEMLCNAQEFNRKVGEVLHFKTEISLLELRLTQYMA